MFYNKKKSNRNISQEKQRRNKKPSCESKAIHWGPLVRLKQFIFYDQVTSWELGLLAVNTRGKSDQFSRSQGPRDTNRRIAQISLTAPDRKSPANTSRGTPWSRHCCQRHHPPETSQRAAQGCSSKARQHSLTMALRPCPRPVHTTLPQTRAAMQPGLRRLP